jgi:hypothetical protein
LTNEYYYRPSYLLPALLRANQRWTLVRVQVEGQDISGWVEYVAETIQNGQTV